MNEKDIKILDTQRDMDCTIQEMMGQQYENYITKADKIDIFRDMCGGTGYMSVEYVDGSLKATRIDPKDVVICFDNKED